MSSDGDSSFKGGSSSEQSDDDLTLKECRGCALFSTLTEICEDCEKRFCQQCETFHMGCGNINTNVVCAKCLKRNYHNKRKYCKEKSCSCDNKAPKKLVKMKKKNGREKAKRKDFNAAAWKASHIPINYPCQYKGRWLVDLYMSDEQVERDYIDWLINNKEKTKGNYTAERQASFLSFVKEAKELKEAFRVCKVDERDQSPERD